MPASPSRNGRAFERPLSDREAWDWPPPRTEAAHCLRVALSNGGIPSMRELIAITEGERLRLEEWAASEPELARQIESAVRFRDEVLREFDHLAGAT